MKIDINAVMAEVKEKSKVFTEAHKCESSEEILAQMRGEDPASEDLEKEIIRYIGYPQEVDEDISTTMLRKAARHFAQWQREQMMKDAIELEVQEDAGGYPYIDKHIEFYDYDKDVPLAKAGDKVLIINLKE